MTEMLIRLADVTQPPIASGPTFSELDFTAPGGGFEQIINIIGAFGE